MAKQITISLEQTDYTDFIEEDCIPKYEAEVQKRLAEAFEAEAEVSVDYSSGWGTKVSGDFDSLQEEEEAQATIAHVLNQIGNDLTSICA